MSDESAGARRHGRMPARFHPRCWRLDIYRKPRDAFILGERQWRMWPVPPRHEGTDRGHYHADTPPGAADSRREMIYWRHTPASVSFRDITIISRRQHLDFAASARAITSRWRFAKQTTFISETKPRRARQLATGPHAH